MNSQILIHLSKRFLIHIGLVICSTVLFIPVNAQENPPKPIAVRVSTLQHLSFGAFIQSGTNGTVTVTPEGARTSTGNIILPNMSSIVTPALFEVTALPGTLITIVNGPDSQLSGSNGGTIMLRIGDSNTGSPFIANGEHNEVFIGGTLTVGPLMANPAGAYSGIFQVTFIQQ